MITDTNWGERGENCRGIGGAPDSSFLMGRRLNRGVHHGEELRGSVRSLIFRDGGPGGENKKKKQK